MKLELNGHVVDGRHGDWTVSKTGVNEKGERYQHSAHYFGRLSQALLHVLNDKLTESDAADVKAVLLAVRKEAGEIKEVAEEAETLLRNLKRSR